MGQLLPVDHGQAERRPPLAELAGRARPVTLAEARLLPVLPSLVDLFPEGGLRRGSTVAVAPAAGCGQAGNSLAGALLAGVTAAGSWGAVAGVPDLGLAGLAEMGADLSRLAIVDCPARELAGVLSALLDAVDVVLVSTRERVSLRPGDARRLAARARERGSVLVVLEKAGWPAPLDLSLVPIAAEWRGLGQGHGRLSGRVVQIEVTGRGAAARPRRGWVWLPAPDGSVRVVGPGQVESDGQSTEADVASLAGAG